MPIVEMDPLLAWKAIEGHTNELDPERKSLDAFYRQFDCKRCRGPVQREYSAKHAFADPNTMTPRALLRCTRCRCLFDPHSGLIIEMGTVTSTPEGIPLIQGEEK